MEFTGKRQRYSLTKEDAGTRLKRVPPEPIAKHAVYTGGTAYPVKQALAVALSIDRLTFNTAQARDILRRLGFELVRQGK